jgi:hypothetical protein
VLSNLDHAVGVVISADLQSAYISEQTSGPDGGRVSRFDLATGTRHGLVTGLTAPFFLTWLDAAQTFLLVPERDPANRVTAIDVAAGSSHVVASGLPNRPSSTATLTAGQILVCSDQAIEECDVAGIFQPDGPLLMGIGFVPFDKIFGGLADTTVDPTYFYQVHQVPFAGTLPLMVNHFRAYNDGARFYRVRVDGVTHTDPWTDEKWILTHYAAQTTLTTSVAGVPGYYPVRAPNELFLWMNPSLGDLLSTAGLSNGSHTIVIEFVNAAAPARDEHAAHHPRRQQLLHSDHLDSTASRQQRRPRLRVAPLRDEEHRPRQHAVQRRPPQRVCHLRLPARQRRTHRDPAAGTADQRAGQRGGIAHHRLG